MLKADQVKSFEKETEVDGYYDHIGKWYGNDYFPVPKLNKPISPAENLARYYRGEKVEWLPDLMADLVDVYPYCIPDQVACDFEGGYDSFGVKWIPDTSAPHLPSFVEPGFILLDDISNWRDLEFPDVDSWDWEKMSEAYRECYADDDRMMRGIILSGFFERLISIMGFEGAAMAMIVDPDEVIAFFDKLADMNIKIVDHYFDDFGCTNITIHDDWASQRSPFFSPDTCMEVIVPALKKVVDHVHDRNGFITLHTCGNNTRLIPQIAATGVDAAQVQDNALDLPSYIDEVDNRFVVEIYPAAPEEVSGEDLMQYACDLASLAEKGRVLVDLYQYDPSLNDETRVDYYRIGRTLAESDSLA